MPFVEDALPPEVALEASKGLNNYFSPGDAAVPALGDRIPVSGKMPIRPDTGLGGPPDKVELGPATPRIVQTVFHLATDQLDGAVSLDAVVRKVGWRFLADVGGKPVASYVSDMSGSPAAMTSVQHGARLAPVLRIARDAERLMQEKLPDLGSQDYTISLICAPVIYIEALWIRSRTSGPQYVIPVLASPGSFPVGEVMAAEAFLERCKDIAANKRALLKPPAAD